VTRVGLAGAAIAFALTATASAQQATRPVVQPSAAGVPAATDTETSSDGDTWIFSGVLQDSAETFSGTLVTGKADTEFELKLADGATCDGGDLHPSLGLVRLSEIVCTDERTMRALFVPQGHETLKVFGHVGDERFATVAHLLGTQDLPEPKQTTEPHAPLPLMPPPLSPSVAPPAAQPVRPPPGADPG